MENNKITVLLNEADIRQMAENAYSEDFNKGLKRITNIPKITAIVMVFMIIASFGGIFIYDFSEQPNDLKIFTGIITAIMMLIALIVLIITSKIIKKAKVNANQKEKEEFFQREMQKRSTGFSPRTYLFENKGICVDGKNYSFVVKYDELQNCYEYAEGILFRYKSNQVFWLPARFFTENIAYSICSKMSDILGKDYILHEKISAPKASEAVSAEKFVLPQSDAELTLNYKLKNYRLGRRLLTSVGYLLKNTVGILFFILTVFFGVFSVDGILSLINEAGEPFSMGLLHEICIVCLAVSMFVYYILSFVINGIVPMLKINKWSNNWYKDGVTLKFHCEGIIEKVAAGDNFIPWKNVDSIKGCAGDLVITDKTGRPLIIPKKKLKDNRKEIESIVKKHLPQGEC